MVDVRVCARSPISCILFLIFSALKGIHDYSTLCAWRLIRQLTIAIVLEEDRTRAGGREGERETRSTRAHRREENTMLQQGSLG